MTGFLVHRDDDGLPRSSEELPAETRGGQTPGDWKVGAGEGVGVGGDDGANSGADADDSESGNLSVGQSR